VHRGRGILFVWALGAAAAALAGGCASAPSSKPPPAAAARCAGTLGFEAAPPSRAARKRLGLPENVTGAVVTSVLAGGPAAAAGMNVDDLVERIGGDAIVYACDIDKTAYSRSCEPVQVVLLRGGSSMEVSVTPVDQGPFLSNACVGGNDDACFRDAWLQWNRAQNAPDLFATACNGGSAEACAYQGLQLSESPDRAGEAPAILEKACELDSGSGCATLGFLYATGKAVKKDDKQAAVLYRKSCDLGDGQGCYNAGLMAEAGRGVKEDAARAAADYEAACELGSTTGCTNLGFLYERGRGVREDRARAVALYQKGCDGTSCSTPNLGGCVNVGRAYRDGIGVAKDEAKAAEIFRSACERPAKDGDPHAAASGARACSLLGGLYIAGEGIPKDMEHGRDFSILGCDRGDAFGCFNAAVCFNSPPDEDAAKAAGYFDRACKLGDAESCHELALAYEKGRGVARNSGMAKALEKQACDLGFAASCARPKPKKKS
jgi:TPR repeat protein